MQMIQSFNIFPILMYEMFTMKMEYNRYFLPSYSCWYGNLGSSRKKKAVKIRTE